MCAEALFRIQNRYISIAVIQPLLAMQKRALPERRYRAVQAVPKERFPHRGRSTQAFSRRFCRNDGEPTKFELE